MNARKFCEKFTIMVEGETERQYFERLQFLINNNESSNKKISIQFLPHKNPIKALKSIPAISMPAFAYVCDIEGSNPADKSNNLINIDSEFAKFKKQTKNNKLAIKYSNLSFELWIILHKQDLSAPLNTKGEYLQFINKSFGTAFEGTKEYKSEKNFKILLSKINLQDVINAVSRSENIMKKNEDNAKRLIHLKTLAYYEDNPSLTIHELVKNMLTSCEIT